MKIVVLALVLAFEISVQALGQEATSSPPIDPKQLTAVSFGSHSHWLQPWRAYLETVPASQFLNGIGIALNSDPRVLPMCAKNGITQVRIEMGWSHVGFDDEPQLHGMENAAAALRACQANGLRPLILLNGHHGAPCPMKQFDRVVTEAVGIGEREVVLDRADDLIVGHSGLNNTKDYIAADDLVTKIDGNMVTLSKPLKEAIAAGAKVPMTTLKYAPFGDAATDEGKATLEGWKRYVRAIADFAATTLGTQGKPDLGFDLEIWNELSFGSNFIEQERYYDPMPHPFDKGTVYGDIVGATAAVADAEPAKFAGVRLENGFSNTIPWPASSQMPPRVTALSHHPYAGRKVFPKDEQKGLALNALGQPETSGFVPAYEECFPEYTACALQTETSVRDMAPLTTDIYKCEHGRFTRPGNPCWCWFTEVNYDAHDDHITDPQEALRLKAKAAARYYCFYLNKGVERLYLYATGANDPKQGEIELGILKQDFVDAAGAGKVVDAGDAASTSPALLILHRITDRMKDGRDAKLAETRKIELLKIEDSHGAKQFEGDPKDLVARPPLYDRDALAVLPYQLNAHKFVIPYYVVTRDVRRDLAPEKFTVTLKGIHGAGAEINAYDPTLDQPRDVRVLTTDGDTLKLELTATDYPILLTIEEVEKGP